VAHLSGVLNKPTFVLLPFVPDWRWGAHEKTTKWYGDVTLCRQGLRGVWDKAFDEAFEGVSALLS
jgi:hypothetical protein